MLETGETATYCCQQHTVLPEKWKSVEKCALWQGPSAPNLQCLGSEMSLSLQEALTQVPREVQHGKTEISSVLFAQLLQRGFSEAKTHRE